MWLIDLIKCIFGYHKWEHIDEDMVRTEDGQALYMFNVQMDRCKSCGRKENINLSETDLDNG